jgi:protein SCO1/2
MARTVAAAARLSTLALAARRDYLRGEPKRTIMAKAITTRLAVAAAGAFLLGAAALAYFTPARTGQPIIGGAFALQSAEGATVTDKDLIGHPSLVYFGYTHCPDICPTTLAQISDVLAKLPQKPVKVYFITVDPERDTAKLMGDYVSSFDPRIVGLSGTPEAVEQVEKEYRVYARKAPGKDGDYAMDHSSVIYLMDKGGHFVGAFNLERSAAEAAKELQTFL